MSYDDFVGLFTPPLTKLDNSTCNYYFSLYDSVSREISFNLWPHAWFLSVCLFLLFVMHTWFTSYNRNFNDERQ